MAPVTSGRLRVRRMTASISRSITIFHAFAPPAAKVPPHTVAIMSQIPGNRFAATTMVGTVVTRSNSMMRGLVNATYALSVTSVVRAGAVAIVTANILGLGLL